MIVEADGKMWAPVPDAAATAEEFAAARALIREIHQSLWWNPWVMTDRAADYDAALEVCCQWTRAEPDLARKTAEEYGAELQQQMVEAEARAAAEQEQAERERAARADAYDPGRAQARLALLEEQGILAAKARECDEVISRELFPGMEDARRDRYLAGLEAAIAARQRVVDELAALVGDAETVCDERGWLPAERRDLSLVLFRVRRETEVRELRARIPVRKAELEALTGRSERAALREALRTDVARLASLEAMPPMTAADMCSECADPARHCPGVTFNLQDGRSVGGPCPAWPQWAQKLEMVRAELRKMAAGPAPEPPPEPKPIAVITLEGPIEDVTAKLAAIQADHPGARIRRGKRNRWEIWPPAQPPGP